MDRFICDIGNTFVVTECKVSREVYDNCWKILIEDMKVFYIVGEKCREITVNNRTYDRLKDQIVKQIKGL